MNQKELGTFELTLGDLRQLGKNGGATAHLLTGEEIHLKANYGTETRKAYVGGKLEKVEAIINYVTLYPQIQTIRLNKLIVAKRRTIGDKSCLTSTGKGYHRDFIQPLPADETEEELQ